MMSDYQILGFSKPMGIDSNNDMAPPASLPLTWKVRIDCVKRRVGDDVFLAFEIRTTARQPLGGSKAISGTNVLVWSCPNGGDCFRARSLLERSEELFESCGLLM